MEDILTAADSAATADFILETLRQFTENPDTEVILSIAGGRKTMSALGALAMSMLGRKNDRLCHVLVNPPFDDPRLRPRFFYPIPRLVHQLDGVECAAESAAVSMHDIPFPRFRELFSGDWGRLPGNFTSLVAAANDVDTGNIRIELAPSRCEFSFGGKTGKLPAAEFLLLWLLAERNINGGPPIQGQSELSRKLLEFHARQSSKTMPELLHWDSSPLESEDYVRKLASRLKASMLRARGGPLPKCLDPCPERGHYGLGLLSGNIHMEKME